MRVVVLIVAIVAATACAANAESSSIGVVITSDRDPGNFADPKNMKYELNGSHTFNNGLIAGGSFEYNEAAFSTRTRENLEGTLGYRVPLNTGAFATVSGGLGEHLRQNPSAAFPYYVLRIGADLELSRAITWNVITFRYRNALDPNDNFNTPQVATGFTCKLDEQRAITAKIMRNWRDGAPSSTGVSLGFRQGF
jgi:hypothetical protein